MTLVPVMVLAAIVLTSLGGPDAFMHVLSDWIMGLISSAGRWLGSL